MSTFRGIKNIQKRYLGPDPDPTPDPKADPKPPKMLSEDEVNKVVNERLAKERKKFDAEKAEHLSRIAKLEPDAQEAARLKEQIEELEKRGKTKDELEAMERKKERERLEGEAKKAAEEAAKWRKKHQETQLERDLMDAASTTEADAANPSQIVTLLKKDARIQQRVVEGKVTDDLETRIKLNTVKEGKPVELDVAPAEAIKLMKEDKQHRNLFNAGIKGGLGGTQSNTHSGPGGKLGMSQAEFNKAYSKGTLPRN